MSEGRRWEPEEHQDLIGALDELRARCPVARSDQHGLLVLHHDDVVRVVTDHELFSSVTGHRLSVPTGMDQPQHTAFRAVIDRYYTPEVMAQFHDECRSLATEAVAGLPRNTVFDAVTELGEPYAARVQSAFMGWDPEVSQRLVEWSARQRRATRHRDRPALAALAAEFDAVVLEQLERRRGAGGTDVTSRLLTEQLDGRLLTDAELLSLIRTWTAGELATIALAVGVVAHGLATDPAAEEGVRSGQANGVVLELLRHTPAFVSNRRVATRPTEVAGVAVAAGERVTVMWASADRDEAVVGPVQAARYDRDPSTNLVYGRGIHACPGEPLAQLELIELAQALVAAGPALTGAPVPGVFPGGGFAAVPMVLTAS